MQSGLRVAFNDLKDEPKDTDVTLWDRFVGLKSLMLLA